jgi:hypothetical protein
MLRLDRILSTTSTSKKCAENTFSGLHSQGKFHTLAIFMKKAEESSVLDASAYNIFTLKRKF